MIETKMKNILKALFSCWPLSGVACWHGPRASNKVAITFDDGPNPEFTPSVLQVLAEADVRATFFVLGAKVEQYPGMLEAIVDGGHEIGIHGFEHSPVDIVEQFERCRRLLLDMHVGPELFRLPGGYRYPAPVLVRLALAGRRLVFWSFDVHDSMRQDGKWKGAGPDYGQIRGGDIVLMHDDNPLCVRELPVLLKTLQGKGLEPVSVSELM